ncbi:MAG: SurA N-terminal domain-containing protein [Gammaproteobacteria bacterium]|nr:SurA N-terminal domain-containing protein [Gammaproteobacteria bacterium]
MLQFIREKSQGWFAWTIIIAICLTFALWGIHSYLYSSASDQTVAKVNGVKISQEDFSRSYNQLRQEVFMRFGSQAAAQIPSQNLKKMALQSLISSIVLNQGVRDAGFEIDPQLLELTIARMPIFQKNGQFSKARFEQVMSNSLVSTETFLEQLKTEILANQLKNGIFNTNFVLPIEVTRTIQLINQKRKFDYLIIPKQQFIKQISLTEQALQDYYKNHQDQFKIPEKISIQYIRLSLKDIMQGIRPSEQQLKLFYQSNLTAYTLPKKWHVQIFKLAVPLGATQETITKAAEDANKIYAALKQARENHETSLQSYQNLTHTTRWITSADLDSALQPALLALKHKNDVAQPIKTTEGYVILKLIETQTSKSLPFAEVKDKVLQAYQQQKAQMQFDDLNDKLANITYESPNSLKPAADQLHLKINTTPLFSQTSYDKKGILQYPGIVKTAFSDDVLNEGNNSEPINISDNDVVVLRIQQHIPAKIKPYNEVKATIKMQLQDQKAQDLAQQTGKNLLEAIQKQPDQQIVLAKKQGLTWKKSSWMRSDSQGVNSEILAAAFTLARPSKTQLISIKGLPLENGDFALVVLKDIELGSPEALTKSQHQIFTQNMEKSLGLMDYQLYVAGLMENAKIKDIKEDLTS